MKPLNGSYLRMTLFTLISAMLITIPVFAAWTSTLTEEDAKLWKMWFTLAKNGYKEPMTNAVPGEKTWWKFWD